MKTLYFVLIFMGTTPLFSSEPVGTSTQGALVDGLALPEMGEGYVHMYRESERFWGTSQMINMLEKAAEDIASKYPGLDRLQVEDIGKIDGGDIDGHASHENGQDVDLGYYKSDRIEHDPIAKNQEFADPMVIKGKVSPNFDLERNWELVKALHRHGDVQKIFIDVVLKNSLCSHAKKIDEYKSHQQVLRSLRHETNHQDHLHVRIRCPKVAKKCRNQPEPPKETGC
ncbi:MAG: penicillin-insensitive murein endopeptidase [Bacteriovorax sp.]|jgi:penicillin-insensitive murein endopeptidase